MTRRIPKSAAKRPARQTRPLPPTMEPEMPAHLRALTLCAMAGTLNAPIGSSLAKIYLEAARNLISAAISIDKQARGGWP